MKIGDIVAFTNKHGMTRIAPVVGHAEGGVIVHMVCRQNAWVRFSILRKPTAEDYLMSNTTPEEMAEFRDRTIARLNNPNISCFG